MKYKLPYEYCWQDDDSFYFGNNLYSGDEEMLSEISSGYFDYYVEENLKDIIEYFYKKKYGKDYNELSYYLEDNADRFIRDIQAHWLADDIDSYQLAQDTDFINFLKDKYEIEAELKFVKKFMKGNEDKWN